LGFIPRTETVAGVGGGLRIQGGPLALDLGYRYKQILGNSVLTTVLGAGQDLHSHQVRVGVGVRF
jgi:opacity protein-like surface antigen